MAETQQGKKSKAVEPAVTEAAPAVVEKPAEPAAPAKYELSRLRPTVSVSLGHKRLVEWPSERFHRGATVEETQDYFVVTTADRASQVKIPKTLAVASYREAGSRRKTK